MVSTETDRLYERHRHYLDAAEGYAASYVRRVRFLLDDNAKLRFPRTGSDLDLTIYTDEYVKAHRADEQHSRAWAVAYGTAYQVERMREIEVTFTAG